MIGWPLRIRVFAYGAPVDMRKSFNTLCALVVELGREILDGDVFLFVSKKRKRAKVLWFDGTGLCLLAKRLEKGRFAAMWERAEGLGSATMTVNELSLFLEGCEEVKFPLSPPCYDHEIDGRVFEIAREMQKGLG